MSDVALALCELDAEDLSLSSKCQESTARYIGAAPICD